MKYYRSVNLKVKTNLVADKVKTNLAADNEFLYFKDVSICFDQNLLYVVDRKTLEQVAKRRARSYDPDTKLTSTLCNMEISEEIPGIIFSPGTEWVITGVNNPTLLAEQ